MVIRLPENKHIVVDSKVSLVAYERMVNAKDTDNQISQLKLHINSIKAHLKGLSEKNYQNLYGVAGLDFVLLFIPIEPAFTLAVQHDAELFNEAYSKNIVIVSPTTLIATLRTISSIWKQEYQNKNALEIARQGGALYDKFVAFIDDLTKMGTQLKTTQSTYEASMKKLYEGAGNLVKRAETIKKLGAKPVNNSTKDLLIEPKNNNSLLIFAKKNRMMELTADNKLKKLVVVGDRILIKTQKSIGKKLLVAFIYHQV